MVDGKQSNIEAVRRELNQLKLNEAKVEVKTLDEMWITETNYS